VFVGLKQLHIKKNKCITSKGLINQCPPKWKVINCFIKWHILSVILGCELLLFLRHFHLFFFICSCFKPTNTINLVNSKLHKRQFIPGRYWRFLFFTTIVFTWWQIFVEFLISAIIYWYNMNDNEFTVVRYCKNYHTFSDNSGQEQLYWSYL
jgi:hypothetical protein